MREFIFTITGNQDYPEGNPIGYHRTTQKAKWNEASQRYEAWKDFVRGEFEKATHYRREREKTLAGMTDIHPLTTSKESHAKMEIEIYFTNDVRADCDNIFKGIADALFENDKYILWGSFIGKISPDKVGRVVVKIYLYEV